MPQILLTYSWSVNNIGDMGITVGLLNLLRDNMPDAKPTVVSLYGRGHGEHSGFERTQKFLHQQRPDVPLLPNPFMPPDDEGTDAHRLDLPEAGTCQPPVVLKLVEQRWGRERMEAFALGDLPLAEAQAMVDYLLDEMPGELLPHLERDSPAFVQAIRGCDFLIYNSGTVMNFGRGEPSVDPTVSSALLGKRNFWGVTLIRIMPLIMANYLKVPFGVNGHSYDAMDWPAVLLFRKLFPGAAFIGARDPNSLAYIRGLGVTNSKMDFRPDSTFFIEDEDPQWANRFLADHGLKPKQFITLTIRSAKQGYISTAREAEHMACLRRFIERWTSQTGMPVVLAPEVRCEIDNARRLLLDPLPDAVQKKVVWIRDMMEVGQARAVYRRALIHVSMDMHSIIMALSVRTPVLHPRFLEAGRKAHMLDAMDMSDWLFDIDHLAPEELYIAAEDIRSNYEQAVERVDAQLVQLRLRADELIGWVAHAVSHAPGSAAAPGSVRV